MISQRKSNQANLHSGYFWFLFRNNLREIDLLLFYGFGAIE